MAAFLVQKRRFRSEHSQKTPERPQLFFDLFVLPRLGPGRFEDFGVLGRVVLKISAILAQLA